MSIMTSDHWIAKIVQVIVGTIAGTAGIAAGMSVLILIYLWLKWVTR